MSVAITERAAAVLRDILDNTDRDPNHVIRLVFDSQGIGLILGKQKKDDKVFKHEGTAIMVIGPAEYNDLSRSTLDVELSPQGYVWSLLDQDCPFTLRSVAKETRAIYA